MVSIFTGPDQDSLSASWAVTPEPEFDQITRLAGAFLNGTHARLNLFSRNDLATKSAFGAAPLSAGGRAHVVPLCEAVRTSRGIVSDQQLPPAAADDGSQVLAAWLAVPVLGPADAIAGVLWVAAAAPRQWSDQEERILTELAATASALIEQRLAAFRERAGAPRVSIYDELTGLYNRQGFFLFAEQHWKLARRQRSQLLLMVFEIEAWSQYRDELGEPIADRLLFQAAAALQETMRDTDIVARVDQAEFAVLALDSGMDGASVIRNRMDRVLERLNGEPDRELPPLQFRGAPPHVITPPTGSRRPDPY
jgi:diguanylate cyclase (GGDEF)-like protein